MTHKTKILYLNERNPKISWKYFKTFYNTSDDEKEIIEDINKRLSMPIRRISIKTEVVIARYNENINWANEFATRAIVYNKGPDLKNYAKYKKYITLKNVGRESHTYLTHIIENYYNLSFITVFLQGRIDDAPSIYSNPNLYIHQLKNRNPCFKNFNKVRSSMDRMPHHGKWKKELLTGHMKPAETGLHDYFLSIFHELPPSIKYGHQACFSVTRDRILRFKLEFYIYLRSLVEDHVNPEEGHYLERTWYAIFSDEYYDYIQPKWKNLPTSSLKNI